MWYCQAMEQTQICRSKPGPKPDPQRAMIRQSFREWSDRTFATYWKGHQLLINLERDGLVDRDGRIKLAEAINKRIARPNGTFSVSLYLRYCEAVDRDIREYDHEHDEAPAQVSERGLDDGGPESATSTLEESS